jgi:L-cysteine desulfidase
MRTDIDPFWQDCILILHRDVVPALGCTEPVAVALAAARCRRLLGDVPDRITARVSANLYKNGMGVGVPGTGMIGLAIAAAIGAVAGDPDGGLEVLKPVRPEHLDDARRLAERVEISIAETDDPVHAEVEAGCGAHTARVVVHGGHSRIVLEERDGIRLFEAAEAAAGTTDHRSLPAETSIRQLLDFAANVPIEEIAFLSEAVRLNSALSVEGESGAYGLRIGATLSEQIRRGLLADDLMTLAMRLSSAASDARMDGAGLPAMSNSGSGNQGISATMPVVAAARLVGADDETLLRAVTLSHIVAIWVKSHQNSLSALCAASTAAMGSGAAITWLLGGDADAVADCIRNMVGDVSGIICDGAKTGCSMKVSTVAAAAVKSAFLAVAKIGIGAHEGIVAETAEETIANLGRLGRLGMAETDREILRIMLAKGDEPARTV